MKKKCSAAVELGMRKGGVVEQYSRAKQESVRRATIVRRRNARLARAALEYRNRILEGHAVKGRDMEGWWVEVPFLEMKVHGEDMEAAFVAARDKLTDRISTILEAGRGLPDLVLAEEKARAAQ